MKTTDFLKNISTARKLLLIILLGFSLRLYKALTDVSMSGDGIGYMLSAEKFASGDLAGGLDPVFPPLYPLLISLASHMTTDFDFAGRIISFFFATLAIPVSFYIGRYVFDERVGLTAAFFAAVHHYMIRYSGEVFTEGLYYFLAAITAYAGLKAIFDRDVKMAFLAGLFSSLAYLTRPEGIGFIGIITLWLLLYDLRRIRYDWRQRLALVTALWGVLILSSGPYLLFMHNQAGEFQISGKISLQGLSALFYSLPFSVQRMGEFSKGVERAFSFPFLALFIFCILKIIRKDLTPAHLYLLSILASFWFLYFCVLPNRRYFTELMPVALVFSAAGFCHILYRLKANLPNRASVVTTALLLLLTANQLHGLGPKDYRGAETRAGKWLTAYHDDGTRPVIMAVKLNVSPQIIVYYADAAFVPLPVGRLEDVVAFGKDGGAHYLAGFVSQLRRKISDFDTEEMTRLKKLRSYEVRRNDKFVIYKLL